MSRASILKFFASPKRHRVIFYLPTPQWENLVRKFNIFNILSHCSHNPSARLTIMETTESKEKETLKRSYGKIVLTLENAILPFEKLETDTISQQDGLSKEIEHDLRILGCELIQTAGILLKLPQVSVRVPIIVAQRILFAPWSLLLTSSRGWRNVWKRLRNFPSMKD